MIIYRNKGWSSRFNDELGGPLTRRHPHLDEGSVYWLAQAAHGARAGLNHSWVEILDVRGFDETAS